MRIEPNWKLALLIVCVVGAGFVLGFLGGCAPGDRQPYQYEWLFKRLSEQGQ
jgi:hypothetical protein